MAAFPTVAHHAPDFSEQMGSALSRTDMEISLPKQAKIKSKVLWTVRMKLAFFSKAEYDSFLTWFETTINRGADWFDWTHPRSGVVYQARFVAGQEFAPVQYRRATLDLIDLPIVIEYLR